MANGIWTILRGTAPAGWLGREAWGKTMGAMGAPLLVVSALAPLAIAAIWSNSGDIMLMQWLMFALAVTGSAGFWFTILVHKRADA